MKDLAVIGTCLVCGQGRLSVARETSSGVLFVMCEECEAEWISPELIKDIDEATHDEFGSSDLLAREELDGHPWQKFLEK